MHASLWTFHGDPDDLQRRYDALAAEVSAGNLIAHLCLRTPDGLLLVDTCPTREAFLAFRDGEWFAGALRRHGLARPSIVDYPVTRAFLDGRQRVGGEAVAV